MPAPPSTVSVAGFQSQFTREFPYGTGTGTVTNADIQRAINEAASFFNGALFDSTEIPIWYYYLSAHILALDVQDAGGLNPLQNQGQGLLNQGEGAVDAKSAAELSMTFDTQDPTLAQGGLVWYHKTNFGKKYLSIITRRSAGTMFTVFGPTEIDTGQSAIGAGDIWNP